jgi:hypothetical protein
MIRYDTLKALYSSLLKVTQNTPTSKAELVSIVFSKDRAMQLDAFLRSYLVKIKNKSPLIILYATSNEQHEQSYKDLKKRYEVNPDILFVKEHDFRKQLLEILEKTTAQKVLLFVDDMIFTHDFDFDRLRQVDTANYIATLTRGKDLIYSTVLKIKLDIPPFHEFNGMLCFKWNDIKIFSDWSFPLGVSGYMFGKNEILAMFNVINFKAPNSLEGNMQVFNDLFINRFGLCTNNAIAACVHANIVQTEGFNPILGTFSTEDLLKLWNENKQIDISCFFDKPVYIAEKLEYTFTNRN